MEGKAYVKKWQSDDGRVVLYNADCLEVLPTLGGVNAVITDPPFSSGSRTEAGKSMRGSMVRNAKWKTAWFSHDNMATYGFLYLMRLLFVEMARACSQEATVHAFIDWRMWPNLYGAAESAGWVVKNCLVWDKKHFGMGSNYRNQHEFILYAERGAVSFLRHDVSNIFSVPRASCEEHPTEKPVELITTVISCVTAGNQFVLDPFMGSGTTAIACIRTGRKFIGIEISPEYYKIALNRIKKELATRAHVVAKRKKLFAKGKKCRIPKPQR